MKQDYEKPQLIEYGDLNSLTAGNYYPSNIGV